MNAKLLKHVYFLWAYIETNSIKSLVIKLVKINTDDSSTIFIRFIEANSKYLEGAWRIENSKDSSQ